MALWTLYMVVFFLLLHLERPGYEFTALWTVRDGVLLYVPWWKVPVNMQPKVQQSLPIDSQWMVPFPFIDRVLDNAGRLQRQVCTALVVQKTAEIPQLQFLAFVVVPVLCNDKFWYRQS